MIHLITYGDNKYSESKKRIYNQAKSLGWFDAITLYSPEDLDEEFKEKFKDILELPRGGGYWIWKPYIIKKHMDMISDNDILIYIDAGCYINPAGVKRFNEYIEMLNNREEGCISFQMSQHKEKAWTTKEIFEHFNINNDSDDILETGQIMATIKMFKKNANAVNIVSAWLNALYRNPLVFTDHYNKNNQCDGFIDNRHDQSVCSIICKLYKTIVIEDETYFENGFGDEVSLKYPLWATKIRI
jgi:hypothetical protein